MVERFMGCGPFAGSGVPKTKGRLLSLLRDVTVRGTSPQEDRTVEILGGDWAVAVWVSGTEGELGRSP